jgi:hypothetical protein
VTHPTGEQYTHELDERFAALSGNASAAERLELVWQYYEQCTGQPLTRSPTDEQRQAVHDWFRPLELPPTLATLRRTLSIDASLSTKEKASRIVSRPCGVCKSLRGVPGMHTFPIDVDPWSALSQPLCTTPRSSH